VDPVPDPLHFRKLVAPGIEPRISGSVARNYDTRPQRWSFISEHFSKFQFHVYWCKMLSLTLLVAPEDEGSMLRPTHLSGYAAIYPERPYFND
jgi:hypothetical protein